MKRPLLEEDRDRFEFGRNWSLFLRNVDEGVIEKARLSLLKMLGFGPDDLRGRTFLDVGSGSGLFSLAARRCGARVHSIDVDAQSVRCSLELRRRYHPDDPDWTIAERSILDANLPADLGCFDVVYSWGVLHHTGSLWEALAATIALVRPDGRMYVAIYNDQGRASLRWKWIKRLYNQLPRPCRILILCPALLRIWGPTTVRDLLRGQPFSTWKGYANENRGMNPWRDVVDWVGGYPFEVARPEEVFKYCFRRQMELIGLKTCGGGRGCNEFVFRKKSEASPC